MVVSESTNGCVGFDGKVKKSRGRVACSLCSVGDGILGESGVEGWGRGGEGRKLVREGVEGV
jgi:hypothetical protein